MTATPAEPAAQVRIAIRAVSGALILLVLAVALLYQTLSSLDRPTVAVVWGALALTAYAASLLFLVGGRRDSAARWPGGSSGRGPCSGTASPSG